MGRSRALTAGPDGGGLSSGVCVLPPITLQVLHGAGMPEATKQPGICILLTGMHDGPHQNAASQADGLTVIDQEWSFPAR